MLNIDHLIYENQEEQTPTKKIQFPVIYYCRKCCECMRQCCECSTCYSWKRSSTSILFGECHHVALLFQLKPVCSLESFKHSGDDWWSPPSQSPRLGAPMSSPTLASSSGYDLFGSTPFVVGGGGSVDGDPVFVVASPSSVDLVRLPPPQSHGSKVNVTYGISRYLSLCEFECICSFPCYVSCSSDFWYVLVLLVSCVTEIPGILIEFRNCFYLRGLRR
jgi:hypothetical protein